MNDIELIMDDGSKMFINNSHFKNFKYSNLVIGINIIKNLMISDPAIFWPYINLQRIGGNSPNITTQYLGGLFMESNLHEGNLNEWDVSAVTNMEGIFFNSKYKSPLDKWDVSSVINMRYAFYGSKYDNLIENWNFSSVDNAESAFEESVHFHLRVKWNASNTEHIFYHSQNYNDLEIESIPQYITNHFILHKISAYMFKIYITVGNLKDIYFLYSLQYYLTILFIIILFK